MKKIFGLAKKKKHPLGTPDNGSVLSAGYDLKEKDLGKVHKAALRGDLAKLKQLAKKNDINQLDKENRTALHLACASGHAEVVQFLVESKAKLNLCDNQNRSALMKGVQGQHEHCVSILLENHAEPNLVDVNGNTALHLAANIPSISTAVLLLQHGAEINAQNKEGFTPLTVAVREDHIEMAEFLLKETAEVNSVDQDQRTPLMLAAGNGQINMVKLLLHFDADITLKDTKGWSADDYAVMNGHHTCSLLIIEHGTQRTDGASVSHQGPNKKKKKLGGPSHDMEAGFSLGGPATDKEEHGANEAGGDFEENSQSESLSRISKSAADEWPSSEDEDESALTEKKLLKVNLIKTIGSKKGKAGRSAERETKKQSDQHSGKGSDSQEGSSPGEEEEAGVDEEEDEDEEEEVDEEEEDEEEEDDDDDEEEEDEEEDDDDEEEEEEEESEEEEENENEDGSVEEDDDCAVAAVQADKSGFEHMQKPSGTCGLNSNNKADTENTQDADICHDTGTSVKADHQNTDAKVEIENADLSCYAREANYGVPAGLSAAEDCVVSAIRVESKFSDEDESLEKECLMSSDQNIILRQVSLEDSMSPRNGTEPPSPSKAKAEESEEETEKDDDDSWNDTENSIDKTWNDSDRDEGNKTVGLSSSTLIALQRNVLAEVNTENADSHSDAEDDAEAFKSEKHRSSWGSSSEGSDVDVPKEADGNGEIVQQKSDVEVQGLQLKETSQDSKAASYADGDQLNTSWDSLSAVTSTKCASPKMDQPQPVSGLSSLSSPRLKSGPGVATVDDSEWDSTENDQNIISPVTKGEAVSPAPKENVIEEKHECSWEEEDKDIIEKASTDPSPLVSSAPEDEDTTRNQTLDDDDDAESVSQESEVERNSDTEKEDNSWDDGDESDDPENQMTMKGKLQPNQIYSLSQKSDEKLAEEDNLVIDDYGKEVAPCSFIDRNEFVEEDTDSEHEDLVDDRKHSLRKDKSEDSDSEHQKLQYDFTTATVKKLDVSDDASKTVGEYVCEDGKSAGDHEPRLIAYLPLENHSVNAAKSRQVSDDFNDEGTKRENSFSSPPTKDDASGEHSASDMNSEALPQTDIDDVDVDSPDEAENSGRRWHEVRDTEEPGIQTDDSTEDDDNNDEDGQVKEGDLSDENDQPEDGGESPEGISTVPEAEGITDKKRDFLSELGLEKGEDDQESWDSESHSENFNLSREEKQSVNIQSLELPTREEDPKETGSSGNDDNQGEDVDKDGTARKEEEKAKWRPLNVLSKLEGDLDQKKDLMEELGLGDVDDLDDASDWDSASSTSKRTLPGRRLASTELEEFPECPNSSGNEEGQDAAPAAPPTPQRNIGSDMKLPITSTTPAPQPHPRARKMLIQKLDSEEESDWEPDEITSSCKVSSADNQLQNKAEPPAVLKPGSPELNLMERDTKSSMDFDKQQQKDKDDMVDRAELDMNNSDHEDDDFRDQSSPEDRVGVGADVPWDKRYEKLWVEVEKREVKSTFKSVTGELKERFGELYKSTCPPENPTEEATSASTSAAEESSDDEEEEAIVRPTARARSTVLLTIPEQRESGLEESATESHDKSMCEESIKDSEQSASESSIHQSPNLLSNDILGSASPSLIAAQKEDTENRSHSTKASGDDQTTSVCAVETEQPADPVFKDTNTDLNKCDTNETDLENECENLGRFQVPAESRCSASSSAISEEDMDNFKLEVDEETAKASMEVEKPTSSWDSGGTTLEVNCEKPETGLTGAVHPVAAKSANRAPVQLHPPVQQPCNGEKHEKRAVEGTSKLELVRGAQHSRAPQTNTHANGDPLSVFDDSSLSDVSDDEGRLKTSGQQKTKNPEEMGMAEDFDELTQSSDTATDDTDSPTSGYRHASLLIQKLDSAILDSTTIAKLQNIFHEYERSIQKARSRHGYLADKVSQMEIERSELKISLEEARDDKSALERNQLELKTEVTNLKFQLKQEQENRRNATMMYNTNRDKLRRMEELHQQEVQEKQKLELTLRNLELEMRTLTSNMKQLEDDHSEAQRLLAQERSARTLQENLLNSHIRKQQEMEEENKRNKSKSNEALSQLTEASDRERELLQQTAALQEQLSVLKSNLEQSKANSSLKESHLLEENETFKEQLEDVRRDLKLSNEAVTQTVFSCNNQLTALKAELAVSTTRLENERHAREALEVEVESTRSRLAGALKEAELCQTGHADAEKALLREKEEHQRLKDRLAGETATSREAVSSLSQKLAKAESDANKMENEVNRVTLQLTEKSLLLDVLQREKNQASARVKDLETALQTEKDSVSRSKARQEATQERLAQVQSEAMLLRQQLEEAQNKGVAKERAVTDAQERFGDILSKLRSDCEERVHLVEERNKELASKAADFRDDIYKLEEEKNERETKLRQLQQELADSLKKLSMSEASLEVNTCYRNDLEKEKARLLKDLDRLKGKLEESEDQYVQAEKRINSLKGSLDEREKEVANATQKLQEALSAAATSAITIKQLEDAVQKLEIENARLEAAAKQQSSKIDALQKDVQETAMGRGHLEDLVANLQSSKMTLEDQLSREVQKQSILSHTAQDSRALWEEELKSRSKLGLRMAELEKEKGELTNQMEIEKRKAKKLTEQKKAVDTRLDQEMKRNTELQKEMYRLRTLLKTAKKKLRDQDGAGAEFGSPSNSLRMDFSRHSQADGAFGRMKDKVDDLQIQLDKEASRCSQLERLNGELKDQVVFLKGLSHSNEQLERSKRHLEEEVLDLRQRMEAAKVEQTQLEQYRHETEERVRQEIQQKLEQVNLFLQSQAASQEALDQIKAANEANLRSQLEQKIRDLEGELGRARTTQQDSLTQRDSTRTELERYQQLYKEELRLRKSLASKLERANSRLSEANSKLLNERSRSLLTSNITNGSLVGPSLDLGSLGSPANYGATLGPLNRSLSLGFPLLNPVTERQNRGVEDYLAKMQSELDRNISKELRNATAELDDASARMSPVGSASRVELDPLNRVKQQYLEVLKKNNRI